MKNAFQLSFLLCLLATLLLGVSCKSTQYGSSTRGSEEVPAQNIAELLRRQPNLVVTGSGNNIRIQIRGDRSFNATNQPLFFLDRMNMGHDFSRIAHINPGDVDCIEVVKDPASLASYGVGASNGVIIVHLKK
ncbi:MAG: hypothetical protein D6730_13065 [Bacteroidetes bacterium]|nr:MAG: hypothetical protein D6730_13065 [Bacteroidota bacterium]